MLEKALRGTVPTPYLQHGGSEPLPFQPVTGKPRLVRDPLLVHVLIHTRHDAQHLARPMGDDNIAAHAVQDVHGLCLARLPGPRHEGVRLGSERAHGTEVDDVAGELGHEHLLDVGADLHGVAAPGGAQVLHARHLGGESDTPEKNL